MSRIIKSSMARSTDRVVELKHVHTLTLDYPQPKEAISDQKRVHQKEIDKLLAEAQETADEIVMQAYEEQRIVQNQIQQEKDEWLQQRERHFQEAYNAGFQQGEEEGMKKGYQDYLQRIKEAEEIVETNKQEYYAYLENAEEVILSLAIASAEKIIGQQVSEHPETFLSIIRQGLKEVRTLPEVQIHCHPSKFQLLIDNKQEIEALFPGHVQCFIYANDDLQQDECYIETNQGRVIVGYDSQLKELKQGLLDALKGEEG
ncbi:flagellar assembly protein FliH [Rossellomorea aquimaris]|uniref:flagellar assembly protein FliH n=1 Tax=Rossellomorea aquimaris TaxID=189382 RepID=UPI001CD30CB2|nr:flagellar assembly protein FliH [Rossellomorea aquimaris]MCA1053510.1 flagellar assembly protein FliH [Rossellomorea aquimaris]